MNCPICGAELAQAYGHKMHPNDPEHGITLYCPNKQCPAQEVVSHGRNAKEAYEIVTAKYKKHE